MMPTRERRSGVDRATSPKLVLARAIGSAHPLGMRCVGGGRHGRDCERILRLASSPVILLPQLRTSPYRSIVGQLAGVAAIVLFGLLLRASLKPIARALARAGMKKVEDSVGGEALLDPTTGKRTARYPTQVRTLGWVVLAIYATGSAYYLTVVDPESRVLMASIAGLAMLLVLYIVLDFQGSSVTWTERSITSVAPWRSPLTIEWRDVSNVRFDEARGTLEIESYTGTKIRLQKLMAGIPALRAELRSRAVTRGSPSVKPSAPARNPSVPPGTNSAADGGRRIAQCEAHGLSYDANSATGCVVCRRESARR